LVKKTITLSYSGNSYADIDGNIVTYKLVDAKNRLDKIDLIAYCGNEWCSDNSIYTPLIIDLFYTEDNKYLGSEEVFFLEIPPAQASIFKTATKFSEIVDAYNDIIYLSYDIDNYLDEISVAAGKVFLVYTSEENVRIVIIKTTGNQSVDLEVIQIPNN